MRGAVIIGAKVVPLGIMNHPIQPLAVTHVTDGNDMAALDGHFGGVDLA